MSRTIKRLHDSRPNRHDWKRAARRFAYACKRNASLSADVSALANSTNQTNRSNQ